MDAINRIVNEHLLRNTLQLYVTQKSTIDDRDLIPFPVATGFLVKYSSHFFLITAKHVFDNIEIGEIRFFATPKEFLKLEAECVMTTKDLSYDNKDIAIIRLTITIASILMINHIFTDGELISDSECFDNSESFVVLGFVSHKTSRIGRNINPHLFGFATKQISISNVEKLLLNQQYNIFLGYNRRKQSFFTDDLKAIGPKDLRGLSGGPIWLLQVSPEGYHLTLVGIMIEHLTRSTPAIVGTKGYVIKSMLRNFK